MGPLGAVADYAIQIIKKMQSEDIKSWCPRQDITDAFNAHAQEWVKHTVWKEECRSWYKNNDTGRVNAIWPGSSLHYIRAIEHPRYEDFEIKHFNKNPWAFLGMGWTTENRIGVDNGANCSPYISLENVDPKWLAAIGNTAAAKEKEAADNRPQTEV